jgi:DNA-binding NarL/FixJ family response regulator
MEKKKILVVGRHPEIMATVERLINSNPNWEALAALTNAEAIQHFDHQMIDLILLCSGIDHTSEADLREYFGAHRPQVPIVQHYGGGSGLLTAEIYQALS